MKLRLFLGSALLLIVSSCNYSANKKITDLFEGKESLIKSECFLSLEKDSVRTPYMFTCLKNELLFVDIHQESFLSEFDKNTGKWLRYSLLRGNGPNEYIHLSNMTSINDNLFVWDSGKSFVDILKLEDDTLIVSNHVYIGSDSCLVSAFQICPIDENYFVASGIIKNNRFVILDSEGRFYSSFGNYPFSKRSDDEEDYITQAFAHQGSIICSPDKKRLVAGNMMGDAISFFDISDLKSPKLCKEYDYVTPKYKILEKNSVAFDKECIIGFINLVADSQYCIGLYNGEKSSSLQYKNSFGGNKLLFFDWDGTPLSLIKLDMKYSCLAIDNENERLFLLGVDPESLEYRLDMIDLNQLSF